MLNAPKERVNYNYDPSGCSRSFFLEKISEQGEMQENAMTSWICWSGNFLLYSQDTTRNPMNLETEDSLFGSEVLLLVLCFVKIDIYHLSNFSITMGNLYYIPPFSSQSNAALAFWATKGISVEILLILTEAQTHDDDSIIACWSTSQSVVHEGSIAFSPHYVEVPISTDKVTSLPFFNVKSYISSDSICCLT